MVRPHGVHLILASLAIYGCSGGSKVVDEQFAPLNYEAQVSKCKGDWLPDGYRPIIDSDSDKVIRSIKLFELQNPKMFRVNDGRMCQFIRQTTGTYCVLHLLKDNSPGGDIEICIDQNTSQIKSVELGQ